MATLADNARGLGRFLACPASWRHVAMVVAAGLGVACWSTGGGFIASWWLATVAAVFAGWLLVAVVTARDGDHAAGLLRKMAATAFPLALLSAVWLHAVTVIPASLVLLLKCWAVGGVVGVGAALWLSPRVGAIPPRLRALAASPSVPWALAGTWFAVYAAMSILKWWRFEQFSQDMAIYEQAVYNTLRGRFLSYSTDIRFEGEVFSRFGDHFEPIILLFVPLYALWATPAWFLLAQAALVALGAVAVAHLARNRLGSASAGLVFAALYLLYPGLHTALDFDFHPEPMALGPLLWGLHLGLSRRFVGAAMWLLLALSVKENIPATVFVLGAYLAWKADRRFGLALCVIALAWGVVAVGAVIPHFSPAGESFYADILDDPRRAGAMESGALAVYVNHRLGYVVEVLGAVGGLCLAAPLTLALSAPEFILHILSRNPWMLFMTAHYHVTVFLGVIVGAVAGCAWAVERLERRFGVGRHTALASLLIAVSVTSLCFIRTGPGLLTEFSPRWFALPDAHARELLALANMVPDEAPVLVNTGEAASHLARRELLIFRFWVAEITPEILDGCERVDYVFLRWALSDKEAERLARRFSLQHLGSVQDYHLWRVLRRDETHTQENRPPDGNTLP